MANTRAVAMRVYGSCGDVVVAQSGIYSNGAFHYSLASHMFEQEVM